MSDTRFMRKIAFGLVVAGLAVGMAGCHFGSLPDPNRIEEESPLNAKAMQDSIKEMYAVLGLRVRRGELTQEQSDKMIKEYVVNLAEDIDLQEVRDRDAWRYADILRQAGRYQESYDLYQRAVEKADGEDRRVNDSLQMARVCAMLKKHDEALKLARSTFDVEPAGKAPILMSVLYELVPAMQGQGKDLELAQLLQEAIGQHEATVVDPESQAGQAFIAVRPHHIQKGWTEAMKLYEAAGKPDLARKAIAASEAAAKKYANL